MRAAATFGFGRVCNLGMLAWHRSEITGKMLGNPSVSEALTSYMLSLRQRKVCTELHEFFPCLLNVFN